mmetsp:Transcript_22581/g.34380  ORF Transcript_22581/g.34380 Transcript_22581/m.34380 type:complete len:398 (+) Transcript_22581:60-1253(+)
MKAIGFITRRRCIGKNLTFADIQVEETDEKEWIGTIIKVVFQRNSAAWNSEFDESFPYKTSKLPYGGKVMVDIALTEEEGKRDDFENYDVRSWELLENPRDEALAAAAQYGAEGISCTLYLRARAAAYSRFNNDRGRPKKTRKKNLKQSTSSDDAVDMLSNGATEDEPGEPPTQNPSGEFSHGDNKAKSMRAKIFASWLIESFGIETLKQGTGVLDIAGGKGKLSIELAVQGNIPSTIVDPLVRKHGKKLDPREAKRIRRLGAPHPNLIAKPFNQSTFLEESEELLMQSSICVGLHPDECTEDILDMALRYNKPVAIVPCCVFPGCFPLRNLPCGKPVRTYEEFLQYLLAKDERLKIEKLSFEGKNQVLFLFEGRGDGSSQLAGSQQVDVAEASLDQ